MSRILVTGSGSGLGRAIAQALAEDGHTVIAFDHYECCDVRNPSQPTNVLKGQCPPIDVLINCAGVNKIGFLEKFDTFSYFEVMDTNTQGIFEMSKWALAQLTESKGTILNITSNAAWTPMTGSLAYNASKAAAHIMTRQLAHELTKKNGITVFGIAPNKLKDTGMSRSIEKQVTETRGWTREKAREYQAAALMTGDETPPELLAEFIAFLLSTKERHRFLSGLIIPYGN